MDKLMHKIGLHGKSFIPMLIGFGCSVPAIMATRTLENRCDRLTTMLVTPLMSCGAGLPIYAKKEVFEPDRIRIVMICNPRGGISSKLTIDSDRGVSM